MAVTAAGGKQRGRGLCLAEGSSAATGLQTNRRVRRAVGARATNTPPTPQGLRGPLTEQEAERGPAGREGQQQVRQAGPRAAHEAAVVGGALAAAQLLQPPPLRRVAGAVRQGPQQHLWPEMGAAR